MRRCDAYDPHWGQCVLEHQHPTPHKTEHEREHEMVKQRIAALETEIARLMTWRASTSAQPTTPGKTEL